jgi:putative redox protein
MTSHDAHQRAASPAPTETTPPPESLTHGWVTSRTGTSGFRTDVTAGRHRVGVDEPASIGGDDTGPTPYDLLLASIGACTAITLQMYARRKGWPLEEAAVSVRTRRSHAADCEECTANEKALAPLRLELRVELRGPLTDEQRTRLMVIAERCPVKQALQRGVDVTAAR